MSKLSSYSLLALSASLPLLFAGTSSAATGAEACGNIELLAVGECHFEFSGGCQAKCEPLSFRAACDGECNVAIDASCTADCRASCDASCQADPGSFDCRAECTA